jgi:hypothetical protein
MDIIDTTGLTGDYIGMARIIDAGTMLTAYARLHPELTLTLSVTDEQLTGNNGCYRIQDGKCEHLQTAPADAQPYTIAQLTHLILTEENPLMSLMMND